MAHPGFCQRVILPCVLSQCSSSSAGVESAWCVTEPPGECACSLAQGVPTTPFNNPPEFILFCWNEGWLWERCLSQFRFCRSDMCLVPCAHYPRLARSMASTFHSQFTVFMIHELCMKRANKTRSLPGSSEREEICGFKGKDQGESRVGVCRETIVPCPGVQCTLSG